MRSTARMEIAAAHQQGDNPLPNMSSRSDPGVPAVTKVDATFAMSSAKQARVPNKTSSKPRSRASSKTARRAQLELEAAEAKARLEKDLIDKRLAAQLAELDNDDTATEYSVPQCDVQEWLSQMDQEIKPSPILQQFPKSLCNPPPSTMPRPPPAPGAKSVPILRNDGDDGRATLDNLASAIKDLATVSAAAAAGEGPHSKMLSRLSTPKDLPTFSGDALEWLQFKQAYDESSVVCGFSEQENLWRLRKCLQGPAKQAVTALMIGATSPRVVIDTLELQFGNPDIIISRIVHDINKLRPMSADYHKEIVSFAVKIRNYVAAVMAVGHDEYLCGTNLISTILAKLPTVLISKWTDYSYSLIGVYGKPKLTILSDFLYGEALKVTKCGVTLACPPYDSSGKKPFESSQHHSLAVMFPSNPRDENDTCRFCLKEKHDLPNCTTFKRAQRRDRWLFVRRSGICFRCLVSRHERDTCSAPVCDKLDCGQAHHRLLHYRPKKDKTQAIVNLVGAAAAETSSEALSETSSEMPSEASAVINPETVTHINASSNTKVLLKTVPITIHGPKGAEKVVALLDDGSTVSLISSELASRVGLRGSKQTMRVSGAWNSSGMVCDSEIVDFNVSNKDGATYSIRARSVKNLNLPVQNSLIDTKLLGKDFVNIISDDLYIGHCKPQLLLGQDNYHLLLPLNILKAQSDGLYLTLTPLGWCIHGRVRAPLDTAATYHSLFISESPGEMEMTDEGLLRKIHEEVRLSFSLDSMGVSQSCRENSEDVKARNYLEQTSVLIDGRWHVGLPWRDENVKMTASYPSALSRLRGVQRKMKADEGYAVRYKERVDHLFQNDYAQVVEHPKDSPRTWYLPHFGVDNPNKKKMRLVFDAAAKSNGFSLNDYLLRGPDLLVSLYGVMLRFREKKVAVTGDIRDMFLRVKILPEDQQALRFLWKDSSDGPLKICAMTSLIFGANCSPFVAQFVKNKNALRFESSMPNAVRAICEQHYMDDYIESVDDEETAIGLVRDVSYIHKQGGFEIRNWISNNEAVLSSLPKESLGPTAAQFTVDRQNDGERVLGLIWYPREDKLGFDVSYKRIPKSILSGEKRPTKREMLRVIMTLFDVYGFLSPFTIKGKILLQETWKAGLEWDAMITDAIFDKWLHWLEMLKNIDKIRLPRHYQAAAIMSERVSKFETNENAIEGSTAAPEPSLNLQQGPLTSCTPGFTHLQMHIFCDASTKAMCTVAYWRWINHDGKAQVAFISSKCRVAPVKHVSVPRLELQAALMAARLADTIGKEHKLICQQRYFWCDSKTVLHWIKNDTRNYKVFVAHRLGEIDELTTANEWRYVQTKHNVADIATRDTCSLSIMEGEWLHGPGFLYKSESMWPTNILPSDVSNEELESVTLIQTAVPEYSLAAPNPERFSSWPRLLKATCTVLSFIEKCKKLPGKIDATMSEKAERLLIKCAQNQSFAEDLENLRKGNALEKKSKLLTLTPALDEYGVLRVSGRINAASGVSSEFKQPIILDGRHLIARLIVRNYHHMFAHGNQETVVNELKQRFWLLHMRPTVKQVTSQCMFCRIRKAECAPPRMGDLPAARLAHHQRPYTFCGVDLFGPQEVTIGRRKEKRYGVLFTCLTVRAVHIEIVGSLTTDSLIMALRRMAARRGWPRHLYSDNGTNLRGADKELRKSIQDIDKSVLTEEALQRGADWTFIPPASPHWGGAWERLIRSVKTALRVVLKERAPREEVLATLMAEVENIVNSRPLSHVSVEPETEETLTPNHFLLGSSSNLPSQGKFDDSDLTLRKQWRKSQRLADMFWRRWIKEVLPEMRPRKKWNAENASLRDGDVVLIADPDSPRGCWPKGIIIAVYPGKDGRTRVVDIKTRAGVVRRSAPRVARIPMDN